MTTLSKIVSDQTVAYVDRDGNTVLLLDKASGRIVFKAAA